jgi:hypothetical protein
LYTVKIRAKNPLKPNYYEEYVAKIRVKYDCTYLANSNLFNTLTSPNQLTIWRNGTSGSSEESKEISFKIGDPDLFITGFKFWHHDSYHYPYSCTKKFEFGFAHLPEIA